uniref:Venom s1 protease 48 n=1 Tax=Pristhesancus plagipennis TaxID=1955184 RepID=A0A1Q1NPH9_PRIPG|nr:venom s1 protease 48 [Pristhesancus plagipennis]
MKAFLQAALFLGLFSLGKFHPLEDVDDSDSDSSEHGVVATERVNNCTCGWANKEDERIVGGKPTKVNEYPMMAGFVYLEKDTIYCGGTIITQRHIITAGHCLERKAPTDYGIFVGHHNYEQEKIKRHVNLLEPQQFFIHEKYDYYGVLKYDIAVVLMKEPIQFSSIVGPACLPKEKIPLEGERLKVLGWGRIRYNGNLSDVLLKVYLDVHKLELCRDDPGTYSIEMDDIHQICTYRRSKDSCEGDSGGPLLWLDPDTNRYTLVGATSYGLGCAKYPAISTEVSYFIPWIQNIISKTDPSQQTCAKM